MSNSSAELSESHMEDAQTALAIAITSGKGGVGKTNITTNLGISLANSGQNVCIFDADTSLANINILLGLTPENTLEQFFSGDKEIDDILLTGPSDVKIVPSANGIAELSDLKEEQQARLVTGLQTLEKQFDYILIDTAAGISENVIRFLQSAQYAVVVISPEPTSLTDAFSLIKVLQRRSYGKPVYTLVNMAKNYKHSMEVFKRFSHAVNKYVHLKVRYLGYIPMDLAMRNAVATQTPVVISQPRSPAARCISLLTQIMTKHFTHEGSPEGRISSFWESQRNSTDTLPGDQKEAPIPFNKKLESSDIIQIQKDKESTRILELVSDALNNHEFDAQQAEKLLEQSIVNHLEQFGSLPAHLTAMIGKEELPSNTDTLQSASDNQQAPSQDELPTYFSEQTDTQQPIDGSKEFQIDSIRSLKGEIDELVNRARQTKKELGELSSYLNTQYQSLYNEGSEKISVSQAPHKEPAQTPGVKASTDERDDLKHSVFYASMVGKKN